MTLAAVAPVTSSGNQTAIWVVLAIVFVFAIVAVLYMHERRSDRHEDVINEHDEQLATLAYQMPALLEWLGLEIEPPVEDDSPEAMETRYPYASEDVTQVSGSKPSLPDDADDCPTDEIPVAPPTVPDGIPLAVQSALIGQRPSPVARDLSDEFPAPDSDDAKAKTAAWVEEQMANFNFTGGRK